MNRIEILEQIARVAQKLAHSLDVQRDYEMKVEYGKSRSDSNTHSTQQLVNSYKECLSDRKKITSELQSEFDSLIEQLQNNQ